ncbi:MAG: hypothetical protein E7536_00560 [Ruminococcaceae bacterium]|nr:hypothetical protein [Oscillospiraceae bacterium]
MKITKLKKLFVCILALVMVMSATSVVPLAADIWSGGVAQVIPAQSNDGFYLIQTAEDLAWFAAQVNGDAGNATMKARLMNDIYLNDIENMENPKNWTPIGDYANNGRVFSGIIDGKGFTIYGLVINTTNDYQGLCGYLENGQVKNLNLVSTYVYAEKFVGTVCGYADSKSSITQVVVTDGHIGGGEDVGGITGYLRDSGNISFCGFAGEINARGVRVGGITGCVFAESTISQSYNLATVYSDSKYVGGIAGTNSASKIISCYNRGKVSGDLRVGGIVGNNVGDIASCYNASEVESISDPPGLTGAIAAFYYLSNITECYYDSELFTGKEDNGIPMASDEMKRHGFISILNSSAGNFYYDYLQKNNGYPIMSWQADQNLWDGSLLEPKKSTDGKYYLINNGRELAWFAALVNGTLEDVPQNTGANAMLLNSIVLNIGNLGEDSNVWTPIGSEFSEYTGEFAGNGFSIRGMYIPEGDVVGLFGATSATADISDITITESIINGGDAVAPVVGVNFGSVHGVKVIYTTVNGVNNVGGIVGENGNSGRIIESSSIYSDVIGEEKVGGIAGYALIDSVIETCCSFNDVSGKQAVGGVVGETEANISRSFNAGNVIATETYAGGIAGRISGGATVSNCYNTGAVSSESRAGGIAGQLRQQGIIDCTYSIGNVFGIDGSTDNINAILGNLVNGTVTNSYFDKERYTIADTYATGLRTKQMTGTGAMSGLSGFSHEYWIPTADTEFFVNYPQLDTFNSSSDYDLYDISVESVQYLKEGLICKVIGVNETSYYKTLTEAAAKIGTSSGIVEITADLSVGTEVVIEGDVTIIPTDDTITITRVKHYFGQVFTVKDGGVLNFGADDATYAALDINGNNVTDITNTKFASSLITVEDGGVFNCYDVNTYNNTALNGGFVNNQGEVNFYGGTIKDGTAIQAGGVIYNKGDLNIYAAEMLNNSAKLAGGVLFNAGGVVNIETGADIHNNTSGEGGALYVGGGTVNLRGGSIYLNSASYGGAISIAQNGKVMLYDGSVYNNTATVSGNGIYTEGTLNFYSGGYIDASNDIFLPTGETITTMAKSVYASPVATVTPETYYEGAKIISGNYTAMNANLFTITPEAETEWHINSGGNLTSSEIKYVLKASFFESDDVPYTSIEEAMADIGDNPAVIQLIDDITLKETVVVKSDIIFESDGTAHTISVPAGFEGPMFSVENGAVLSLGSLADDYETDVLYINGSNVTADAIVDVKDGSVKIYSGTVVFGADEIDSAIKSVGVIEMHGGKVTENAVNVGAIYIADGSFNFFAGTIFDNTNIGIYSDGTLNIYDGAGVDESNIVYLTDGKVINVQRPDPVYDEDGNEIEQEYIIPDKIATIDYEKYYVDTPVISTKDDVSKYSGKFSVIDPIYTVDDDSILRADYHEIKDNATIKINDDYVYNLSINSYTVKSLCLQYKNTNIAVYDENSAEKTEDEKIGTGDRVVLLDSSGTVYRELSVIIYGDADGDGDVNANDSFVTKMYIYGWFEPEQFTAAQLEAMDVNHDGLVDETDALIMEKVGVGTGVIVQSRIF